MYKVIVRDMQIMSENTRVKDIYKHFAERADKESFDADMVFFLQNRTMAVITKQVHDDIKSHGIDPDSYAIDYAIKDYPFITEDEYDEYVKKVVKEDTPVVSKKGVPLYVITKGYVKTDHTEHYMCKVLSGLSKYDLSINADMSVSCNCILRECGKLGDLRKQTLLEIFDSDEVRKIREDLYNGYLLTMSCAARCNELIQTTTSVGKYYLENYSIPKAIMFENTSVCNLKCNDCFNRCIKSNTVSLDDVERVSEQLIENGIRDVHMFKYGEPFADTMINKKIDILRKNNSSLNIYTSTNGALLHMRDNYDAALKMNRVDISLDGVDDESASEFQIGQVFEQTYRNMCELVRLRNSMGNSKPRIIWKYVLFPHNDSDEQISKAIDLAVKSGVDGIQFFWGFNAVKRSGAIWKSEVFLPYMKKYSFGVDDNKNVFSLNFH